ncbi:MAG: amidohydrolase family protein [Elusimicrobia bacterium]|nr:amidohydrolase family protein [Elusimicrobiota bacterium]
MSGLIDVHCHLAALPTAANGCKISAKMLKSPAARMVAYMEGLPLDRPEEANAKYLARLSAELGASTRVSQAVALAMDGVYDDSGRLDEAHTEFLISNDFVFDACRKSPKLLAGASVNPRRRDALDELSRCAGLGAALVKSLPNAQVYDPADPAYAPYWKRMAELGLPLLSHIGFEFTLIGHDQSVGYPERLIGALEAGVKVIAAHGCSNGVFFKEPHLKTMEDMMRRFPNFYVDLSALSLPNRVGALLRLSRRPDLSARFLFGTDYPLPCFSYPALAGGLGAFWGAFGKGNRFDRHAAVLDALGVAAGADPRAVLRLPA